ncbi:MAG: hypothetical protein GXY83_07590 [Rhodopirellula sp.]|nr:hypothetical protein [Rhodopirellula sp.]
MLAVKEMACCAVLCCVVILGAGCGESGPEVATVDVGGTVTLDGKPLQGVTVMFIGEGADFVGMGKTGPDGKYQLDGGSIPDKTGAMPGMNEVYFTQSFDALPDEPPVIPVGPNETLTAEPKDSLIPPKYSNPAKPALTFDVPAEGTQSADFQLSSR